MNYSLHIAAKVMNAFLHGSGEGVFSQLLTDSRTVDKASKSLFFALSSDVNNGHRYIPFLYSIGVRSFVVTCLPDNIKDFANANFLLVKDVKTALQALTRHHRERFSLPVIGITGSLGKTVIKEWLFHLLNEKFTIVRSPRSYNSQIGVPLSLWQIESIHNMAIMEAGISKPGEMEVLEKMIAPTIGVLSNINMPHDENFNTREQKCIEKLKLFKQAEFVVYNGDDELVASCINSENMQKKGFEWSRTNPKAKVYISNIVKEINATMIVFFYKEKEYRREIPFTDDASIENALHCISVMFCLNIAEECLGKLPKLERVEMRLEMKEAQRDCMIINDAYNSDVYSLEIALGFMQSRYDAGRYARKIVILSDILQTGLQEAVLYKRVSKLIENYDVDFLVGIGEQIEQYADMFGCDKLFFRNTNDFLNNAIGYSFHNELILLKGARSFGFERIAERMESKQHQTVLEVDLAALVSNFNYFRRLLKFKTKTICMIKADAYGAGAVEVAKTLQLQGADFLAVAVADEGEQLRANGISIPIIVMNPERSCLDMLFRNSLQPEIYSMNMLDEIITETKRRGLTSYPIHLKFDTGMLRLGFKGQDVSSIAERINQQSGVSVASVFSHLAGSDDPNLDEFTHHQYEIFNKHADDLERKLGHKFERHILNSAGIERFPSYQMDMVRIGIGLYGISAQSQISLETVSTLRTVVLQIQEAAAHDSVGYNRRGVTYKNTRIAILPIGYADGFDRRMGNGRGNVYISGRLFPTIGSICMDSCMIDIGDTDIKVGDKVEVFGKNITINKVAKQQDTIPYEILTSVSGRVKRIYFRE